MCLLKYSFYSQLKMQDVSRGLMCFRTTPLARVFCIRLLINLRTLLYVAKLMDKVMKLMVFSKKSCAAVTCDFLFFLFLPLSFIYKLLESTSSGMLPPYKYILSAYVFLGVFYLVKKYLNCRKSLSFFFELFVALFFFMIVLSNVSLFDLLYGLESAEKSAFEFHLPHLFFMVAFVCLGVGIVAVLEVKFTRVLFSIFILMSITVVNNVSWDYLRLDFSGFTKNKSVYLMLADYLAIFCLVILLNIRSVVLKYLFFATSVIIIYFIFSRSSFYFYIFSSLLYLVFAAKIKVRVLWALMFFVFFIFLFINKGHNVDFGYSINRMLAIFNITSDGSYQGRVAIFVEAFKQLEPIDLIFGGFGWQVTVYGDWNHYTHNFISVLYQFGVLGFILYCYMILVPVFYFLRIRFISHVEDEKKEAGSKLFILSFFVFLLMFASRSYIYPYVFLVYFAYIVLKYRRYPQRR